MPGRRGLTLIEMLIVVTLVMILLAASVPKFRVILDGRRAREAGRSLSMYLGGARMRAIESRRPYGVRIIPSKFQTNLAYIIDQVEVPPAYGGDDMTAAAAVKVQQNADGVNIITGATLDGFTAGAALVKAGDWIQFNYQGPWYQITAVSGTAVTLGQPDVPASAPPYSTEKVPYKIRRQPVSAATTRLEIGSGAIIDLTLSTVGVKTLASGGEITILFSANGNVDQVIYAGAGINGPVTDPIRLLMGKRENLEPQAQKTNLQDANNVWIDINPQTGLIKLEDVVVKQ
jgi:prepilin-type N-terminal cleavage/methylation domain-containing protein